MVEINISGDAKIITDEQWIDLCALILRMNVENASAWPKQVVFPTPLGSSYRTIEVHGLYFDNQGVDHNLNTISTMKQLATDRKGT